MAIGHGPFGGKDMGPHWFYVENNEKAGPVGKEEIIALVKEKKLSSDSYVWTSGFSNWKKMSQVDIFSSCFAQGDAPESFDWSSIDPERKIFFIAIGKDRTGGRETTYGPYSLDILSKLYKEKRIGGSSHIWASGMKTWQVLGSIEVFEEYFGERPPNVGELERRGGPRRPFIARLFFHNNDSIYEGVCRDISLGGMQVLVPDYPAQHGETISLNVHPENSDFNFVATGEIVRVLEGGQGFCFRFSEMNDEAKMAITKYIKNES